MDQPNHRLDFRFRQAYVDLYLDELTALYQSMRAIIVSDSDSRRVFQTAFDDSCGGYVCLDAKLGRCVLAVSGRAGKEYFAYDCVSPAGEVDAFFGAADGGGWTEVVAQDAGGGIVRFRTGDGRLVCVDKGVCRLLFRTE